MITEDFVSPELAKLLKDKGFDGGCYSYYREYNKMIITHVSRQVNNSWFNDDYAVTVPTLQMAMKWLREVHKIFIDIDWDPKDKETPYFSLLTDMENREFFRGKDIPQAKETYEEACEAAIKYCLENLI